MGEVHPIHTLTFPISGLDNEIIQEGNISLTQFYIPYASFRTYINATSLYINAKVKMKILSPFKISVAKFLNSAETFVLTYFSFKGSSLIVKKNVLILALNKWCYIILRLYKANHLKLEIRIHFQL